MRTITITPKYTYDDVLIKPKFSTIMSRSDVLLHSRLTKNITLNTPIISSNMDTITEDKMAIAMAKLGGLGIIHRYCSIEEQTQMVKKVKRHTNYLINDPYKIPETSTIKEAKDFLKKNDISSLLIYKDDNKLTGIFTNRDLQMVECTDEETDDSKPISQYMTSKLIKITIKEFNEKSPKDIIKLLNHNRIQKLPVVNNTDEICGLVTLKDMNNRISNRYANLDKNSQLRVGCAIGVNKDYMERADAVLKAGCDIICIDVAHGHHKLCGDAVLKMKQRYPNVDIIAGNVCTADGVEYLTKCGADCIKVGIGPGSICITRKQTGCGSPQLSSVIECANMAKTLGVTIIADGGHHGKIGNIFKALAAGACASMLGGMISGTLETPGQIYTKMDKKVKQIRGMAGIMSNFNKSAKLGQDTKHLENITPEGVEGYVTYKGPVKDIIKQIEGGIKSGLSYVGCQSLEELDNTDIEFQLMTNNGYKESGSHSIKEI